MLSALSQKTYRLVDAQIFFFPVFVRRDVEVQDCFTAELSLAELQMSRYLLAGLMPRGAWKGLQPAMCFAHSGTVCVCVYAAWCYGTCIWCSVSTVWPVATLRTHLHTEYVHTCNSFPLKCNVFMKKYIKRVWDALYTVCTH